MINEREVRTHSAWVYYPLTGDLKGMYYFWPTKTCVRTDGVQQLGRTAIRHCQHDSGK